MIEAKTSANLNEVIPLIREYQAFYNVLEIDDERNKYFFSSVYLKLCVRFSVVTLLGIWV